MALEIERKFLLKNADWKRYADAGVMIKQGYLSLDIDRTVRVRIRGKSATINIKGRTKGMTRTEFEYEIPYQDAKELIKMCKNSIIEKTRFIVTQNGLEWEIDIFNGDNMGLEIVEVELRNENQKIDIPSWVGKEVTDDVRYYNANLVNNSFLTWGK